MKQYFTVLLFCSTLFLYSCEYKAPTSFVGTTWESDTVKVNTEGFVFDMYYKIEFNTQTELTLNKVAKIYDIDTTIKGNYVLDYPNAVITYNIFGYDDTMVLTYGNNYFLMTENFIGSIYLYPR